VVEFSGARHRAPACRPKMIERIYEAFYSTKSEGMGIGLKLCRSIVESHHGRMRVENLYNGEEVVGLLFQFLDTRGFTVDSPADTPEPSPGLSDQKERDEFDPQKRHRLRGR
jgi:hypothetical protein